MNLLYPSRRAFSRKVPFPRFLRRLPVSNIFLIHHFFWLDFEYSLHTLGVLMFWIGLYCKCNIVMKRIFARLFYALILCMIFFKLSTSTSISIFFSFTFFCLFFILGFRV